MSGVRDTLSTIAVIVVDAGYGPRKRISLLKIESQDSDVRLNAPWILGIVMKMVLKSSPAMLPVTLNTTWRGYMSITIGTHVIMARAITIIPARLESTDSTL